MALLPFTPHRKHYGSLLLMSMSVILWEILLTRIYSVQLYYHFAFMAVSIAMLGLTLGALLILFRSVSATDEASSDELGFLALSTGVLMAVTISLQVSWLPPFKGARAFSGMLFQTYLLSVFPFIPAGAFITLVLTRYKKVNQLYAADLLGAGLACLGVPCLLTSLGGPGAALFAAAVACLAASFCFGIRRRGFCVLALVCAVGLAVFTVLNTQHSWLRIRWRHAGAEAAPLYERWNAFSRIQITPATQEPFGWGLSTRFQNRFPPIEQLALQIDSGAGTFLTRFTGDFKPLTYLRYDVTSFAHYLRPQADVLVIGPGGGRDVLAALVFHQRSVRGVEVNPAIVHAVNTVFCDFTGHLYRRPDVSFIVDEGRSYLHKTNDQFDIIQASLVDTVAATAAGAYSFTENGLYTVEAWKLFLNRLKPQGVLTFSRWYYGSTTWPVEVSRLVALGAEALRSSGIADPTRHLLVVRNKNLKPPQEGIATLIVSKAPFSQADMDLAKKVCGQLDCDVALAQGRGEPLLAEIVTAENREDVYRQLPLDISPPTDDKPYFFFHARLADVFAGRERNRFGGSAFNLPAVRILLLLLGITLGVAGILVAWPGWILFRCGKIKAGSEALTAGLPAYFAMIGVAFMFIEIAWMQRFSLFLGHPTYGFTVILFGLLVMCALGSWGVSRLNLKGISSEKMAALLFPLLLILDICSPSLLSQMAGAPLVTRIAVTFVFIGLPAVLMGFYFPLGMGLAQRQNTMYAGWCWTINGALSVTGSVLAMLSCLMLGIHQTIWIGACIYAAAALLLSRLEHLKDMPNALKD
jgi:hypothetical protein